MSQSDYYGGYNNTPTSQQAAFNPTPMPPGMPPMPPGSISGMPAFPPGFPLPPPPMAGSQQPAAGGNQYGASQPDQQFNQQSQYQQQPPSKPSFGQQNNSNAPSQQEIDFAAAAKNENRDVIENQIFITNLNTNAPPTQDDLKERFGSIGIIKMDKKTRTPRIKVWPEKGCASVTYEDPSAASAAISWFSGKDFAGSVITVELATKSEEWSGGRRGERSGGRGGGRGGGGFGGGDRGSRGGGRDFERGGGRDRSPRRRSRSRSPNRGGGGQKEGDWSCAECSNSNFARRTECNRCKAPKPGGGYGGGERRGSDRGGYERRDRDRRDDRRDDRRGGDRRDDRRGDDRRSGGFGGRGGGRGGGNVRDGDWPCPKCGVNNFASRSECFKCHASK